MMYKKMFKYLLLLGLVGSLHLVAMKSFDREDDSHDENLHRWNNNLPDLENNFEIKEKEIDDWEISKLFTSPVKKGNTKTLAELQDVYTPIVNKELNGKRVIQAVVEKNGVSLEKKRKVIKQLFKSRSLDPNVQDEEGRTPLHYAIQTGQYPVFCELINQNRVNFKILDHKGRSVFDYVFLGDGTRLQKDKMILKLIKKAYDSEFSVWEPNLLNNSKNLLHICAQHNLHKSAKWLLVKRLIDPNEKDDEGNSPLLCAFKAESFKSIEVLTNINKFLILGDDIKKYLKICQTAYNYCMSFDNSFTHIPSYDNLMAAITVLQNMKKARKKRNQN